VVATVVPCPAGYLSVRLKPTSTHLDTVKAVYPELRALEQELGGDRELDRKAAMQASAERLLEILHGAGYEDYESFMHQALAAELASRAAQTGGPVDATGPQRRALDHMRRDCLATTSELDGMFGADLDGFLQMTELSRQLSTKSGFVLELSESLRLFALNALLTSSRLGDEGTVLGTVAGIIRSSSAVMRDLIAGLSDELTHAAALLREVGFRVSIAKLQALMAIQFTDEVLRRRRPGPEWAKFRDPRTDDIALVGGCLQESLALLRTALCALDSHLHNLAGQVVRLQQDLRLMGALETNGRIEAARTDGAEAILQQFHEMHEHILQALAQVKEFSTIAQIGRAIASPAAIEQLDTSTTRLRADTAELIASGLPAEASPSLIGSPPPEPPAAPAAPATDLAAA
jgi:aerotaxis receptor